MPDSVAPSSSTSWEASIKIFVDTKNVYETTFDRDLSLGRQRAGEADPYTRTGNRVVVAPLQESDVSRDHVRIDLLPASEIRLTNLSTVNPIVVGADQRVPPGESATACLPALVTIPNRILRIDEVTGQPNMFESFSYKTTPPGSDSTSTAHVIAALGNLQAGTQTATGTDQLLRGLEATIKLTQNATNRAEYLSMATDALIDVAGLETAAAVLWDGKRWHVAAFRSAQGITDADEWMPSRSVLDHVAAESKTFWNLPDLANAASLVNVNALVAAPILNRDAEVIGALYGDRRSDQLSRLSITEPEAILVELLATSAAAGIARLEQEQAATRARVLFEQFFTPELSHQLEIEPDLLLGKDAEITLLSCDIRRLSEVSEQLGARLTIDWVQDVIETLSTCIANNQGVLVDALGDRLIGMWGAPVQRDDHAELACRTAIAMVDELPGLNRRWLSVLDKPIDLGIGIHSGTARVGNIGSTRKFKYGPLGTTVGVTARVEQATRDLRTRILISEATANQLPENLATRRLCRLDDNDGSPLLELLELATELTADWDEVKRRFEGALDAIARDDLPTATSLLAKILSVHPSDRAALRLIGQINKRTGSVS